MKRTITTTYDIEYHRWADEAEVAAALEKYPALEWAAIAVYRAEGKVFGDAILRVQSLLDSVEPAIAANLLDLPTMMSMLADPFVFKPEDLATLRSLLFEILEVAAIRIRGNTNRLVITIEIAIPDSMTTTIEVRFVHTSHYANGVIVGIPFPLGITVRVLNGPDYFGHRSVRYGGSMLVSRREDFKSQQIRNWIGLVLVNRLCD